MELPKRPLRGGALPAALLAAACGDSRPDPARDVESPSTAAAGVWFEEDARRSGLDFTHVACFEQRFDFPEIMGGGVGMLDVERDGWLDLYLVQSGDLAPAERPLPGNRLFLNRGDGTFVDDTQRAGVGDTGYGMGCACADYDGDGRTDIYVTNVGPNVLYRNLGEGTFADTTAAAGVAGDGWSTSAAFCDLDADGDLDLYVVDYVVWAHEREHECSFPSPTRDYCSPNVYKAPAHDVLYLNRGDGTFEDVSESWGVTRAIGNGLGVATGDMSGDGRPDLYIANDMQANQLWVRGDDGVEDVALLSGCALSGTGYAESGMGVQAVDIEGDGDLDLFLSHLRGQTNTFYRNDRGRFRDVTAALGLSGPSKPFTGFGLTFADFDHDADLDLYVANGHVIREEPIADPADPYAQENQLYEQREPQRFAEVMPRGGVAPPLVATSRGAAFGDLDNDGDMDAVIVNRNGPAHLLRNRAGERGAWILLHLTDRAGRDALGAIVRLRAGGREQVRRVDPNHGYCSSNDPRVHFGLAEAEVVDELEVRWPDGSREAWSGLAARRIHELRQGQGHP